MEESAIRRALELGHLTAEDVLRQTAADRTDEVMRFLKTCRPYDEVCHALFERMGGAPLDQFETLKAAFFNAMHDVGLGGQLSQARITITPKNFAVA